MYPYWADPYWGYYQGHNSYQEEPPITQEESNDNKETNKKTNTSEEDYYTQMPYWNPYYAYYAAYYGYYPPQQLPQSYSPHAFYHSTETDDYSSTDEMTYYGARGPTPLSNNLVMLNDDQITPTDTEVESINSEKEEPTNEINNVKIETIKSVSDIQVYNNEITTDEQSLATTEDDDEITDSSESQEEDDSASTEERGDGHLPHQLSVIFEESELSESRKRGDSVATTLSEDDSSTTIEGGHETEESCDEDLEEATVLVRLPLTLKFGMLKDGIEGVTQLIVGDSEMKPGTPEINSLRYICSPLHRQHSNETIENYETAEESDAESRNNSPIKSFDINSVPVNQDDTDFWTAINKIACSDTQNDCRNLLNDDCSGDADISDEENVTQIETINPAENSKVTGHHADYAIESDVEDSDDNTTDSDDDSSIEDADDFKLERVLRDAFASDAVNERVRVLREAGKFFIGADSKEEIISVRQRIMMLESGEPTNATASRSSSMKGCDMSEEDGDSGVTSDVSRHTDTESENTPEGMKRRYERAATHSRLFKLLQDECAKSDDEDDDNDGQNMDDKHVDLRKKHLNLPLNNSEPESGICSPASPTWLAKELVHELLDGRSGRKYKSLPLKKLYEIAQRILQEDARSNISEDSCPLQVSYALEYKNYYNSFEEASSNGVSALKRGIARCPRVKSEKNVPVHLLSNTPDPSISSTNHDKSQPTSPCRLPQQVTSAS